MAFVTKFEFEHLSGAHLERLQRIREELERTIELQRSIDNGLPASLKDYWKATAREKNVLRYEVGAQEWRGESVY